MKNRAQYSYIDGDFHFNEGQHEFDYIVPGFVDIHCHGGGGKYFSEDPLTARALHKSRGTSIQLASLVTAPIDVLISHIKKIQTEPDIIGIHLEGPYLSEQYCGAHDRQLLKNPDLREIQALIEAGKGLIKMITIAPELDGAIDAISWLNSQGVIVAIGHSAANSEATQNAIDAGAKVVTHFNNAMAKLGSTNSLQEVALKSDLYLELIYDGRHVSSQDALFIINSAKGRVLSVTDAMSAAGEPDGSYAIGNLGVDVRDGIATLSGTHTLAGSTLTMLDAFKNLVELKDFESAVHMTSLIPAQVLGINHNQYIGIKGSDVTYL